MAARSRRLQELVSSEALLLRRVDYGESDLVLTLLTKRSGRVSALARGARKSRRRFGGVLEALHTLEVVLDERGPEAELFVMQEAKIVTPRPELMSSLAKLEAAGKALSWVRRAAPPRTPEPEPYFRLEQLLDRLRSSDDASARRLLAETGLALLASFGWAIDFERCVRCGRAAGPEQSASVDAARGGLICRNCGGARLRIAAPVRRRLARASAGETDVLEEGDGASAMELVEAALGAHAGIE